MLWKARSERQFALHLYPFRNGKRGIDGICNTNIFCSYGVDIVEDIVYINAANEVRGDKERKNPVIVFDVI